MPKLKLQRLCWKMRQQLALRDFSGYTINVKRFIGLSVLKMLLIFPLEAYGQFCPGCIQNSDVPQNAQFNVSSATVRGQFTAGTLSISTFSVSTLTATTALIGPGSLITGLNASNISQGNISSNSVVGPYPGIDEVGILSVGNWEATPVGTQYGGTGQNFVDVSTGSLVYFGGNGVMDTLLPGSPLGLLQSMGSSSPEVWTSSPQVSGINLYNISLNSLNPGTLPTSITVSTNSIPFVNGTSVIGNISGQALGGVSGTVSLTQLSTGTLPNDIPASSITVTGVSAGTYGTSSSVGQYQVGTDGRIITSTNVPISISANQITGGTFPSGLLVPAANVQAGSLGSSVVGSSLAPNGSNYGTFGSASVIPTFTSGNDGRILAVSTMAVSIPASGINTPIQFSQISTGTLPTNIVASSVTGTGISAGTYGSATQIPQIQFGTDGRAISAANVVLSSAPGGPAGGALNGNYPNPGISPTGVIAATYGNVSNTLVAMPVITVNSAGQITSASQQSFVPTSPDTAFTTVSNPWTQTQTFPNVIVGPSLSSTTAGGNFESYGTLTSGGDTIFTSSSTVSGQVSTLDIGDAGEYKLNLNNDVFGNDPTGAGLGFYPTQGGWIDWNDAEAPGGVSFYDNPGAVSQGYGFSFNNLNSAGALLNSPLKMDFNGNSTFSGNATVGGNLGVAGDTTLSGYVNISNPNTSNTNIANFIGENSYDGKISITSTNTWNIDSASDAGQPYNGGLFFQNAGTFGGITNVMDLMPNGNVGIQTPTPSAPLEVSGANAAGNGLVVDSSATINGMLQIGMVSNVFNSCASATVCSAYCPAGTYMLSGGGYCSGSTIVETIPDGCMTNIGTNVVCNSWTVSCNASATVGVYINCARIGAN